MKSKRLNGMTALSKFLVLLAIFLLANLGDTFINLSSAAGYLVRVNHLIWFVESMSKPTNKSSSEPTWKPTNDQMNDQTSNEKIQQLEQDALLPDNLSSKWVTFSNMGEIKIQSDSPDLSQTQFTSNTSYAFEAVNGVNHDHDKLQWILEWHSKISGIVRSRAIFVNSPKLNQIGKGQNKEVS